MDERTDERSEREESQFERAAERFRQAGGLVERAAERFRQAGGFVERAAERFVRAERSSGRAGGTPERTDGQAGRTDVVNERAAEWPSRPDGLTEPDVGQSDRTAIRGREVRMDLLAREMDRLSSRLERAKIAEYVDLLNRPLSLVWRNFVGGMARGIGIAIGFTFFAATILYVLQLLGKLNLPIIGDYIADIVRIVQRQLEGRTY